MGHLGILPQSQKVNLGTKAKQVRKKRLLEDAILLQKSGVFSIVLECVETNLAKKITKNLKFLLLALVRQLTAMVKF